MPVNRMKAYTPRGLWRGCKRRGVLPTRRSPTSVAADKSWKSQSIPRTRLIACSRNRQQLTPRDIVLNTGRLGQRYFEREASLLKFNFQVAPKNRALQNHGGILRHQARNFLERARCRHRYSIMLAAGIDFADVNLPRSASRAAFFESLPISHSQSQATGGPAVWIHQQLGREVQAGSSDRSSGRERATVVMPPRPLPR